MEKIKRSVSLYSFQDSYVRGRMTLEDMFAYLRQNGCGMEMLSDQNIPNTPRPTEETYASWDRLVEQYGITPVCNDIFVNINLFEGRTLSTKEGAGLLKDELRMAKRLGFPMVRLISVTPLPIIEAALDEAEKLGIIMTIEIHGSMSFQNPVVKKFIEFMKKTGSDKLGLVVDTGIFCRRYPRVDKKYHGMLGTNQEVQEYVDAVYARGSDILTLLSENGGEAPKELKKLYTGPYDPEYIELACTFENTPVTVLDDYMPYIKHIHGKVFEMAPETGQEYSIDYPEIISYLKKRGYEGYISTEYEGNRYTLPGQPVREIKQVTAHQQLLKKLIGE